MGLTFSRKRAKNLVVRPKTQCKNKIRKSGSLKISRQAILAYNSFNYNNNNILS